jgi:acyl-CoA thioesterase YciA
MQIRVDAWRRSRDSDDSEQVTEAVFTFVALDAAGRPRPVPVG